MSQGISTNGAKLKLGAALRTARQCKAQSPARNSIRADVVDDTRCRPGMTVLANFNGVPVTDSQGRFAHVRGITIKCLARFDITGPNQPLTAYQIRALFQALTLQDAMGTQYYAQNVDGRDILDDQFFRNWRNGNQFPLHFGVQGFPFPTITTDNGVAAAAPVGEIRAQASLTIPLTRVTEKGRRRSEGVIPLALLQRYGIGAFQFRVGTAVPGDTAFPVSPNVNFLGFMMPDGTTQGLEIWLDVVYLDGMVIDAPWNLAGYFLTEQNGILQYPDLMTEYAWIRYRPEDTGGMLSPPVNGQTLAALYDGVSLTSTGFALMNGFTNLQVQERGLDFYASEPDGAWMDGSAQEDLPLVAPGLNALLPTALCMVPVNDRANAPAGPLAYSFQNRVPQNTRFLHRTVSCHTVNRTNAALDALGLNNCRAVKGIRADGRASDVIETHAPMVIVP